MPSRPTTVYHPSSVQEVQTILRNVAGVSVVAGCTEIARRQTSRALFLPAHVIALSRVDELRAISKTERYLEFGASVTLGEILALGKKNLPEILHEALSRAANPGIRALATIGGNVCASDRRLSLFAPLIALDAKIEVRTQAESTWVSLARYAGPGMTPEFVSKVRVPTDSWDVTRYRRLGREGIVSSETAHFVFLAKSQKNILSDIRIAYADERFFRRREYENLMIGRSLPLSEKDIVNLMDKAELFVGKDAFPPSFRRSRMMNLLRDALGELT